VKNSILDGRPYIDHIFDHKFSRHMTTDHISS
jgi:hypothetical protein